MNWIVDELPPEHDSVFSKYKNHPKFNPVTMFIKCSNVVLVTIEHKGDRFVSNAMTRDKKWSNDYLRLHSDAKVVAWMPYPEPFNE